MRVLCFYNVNLDAVHTLEGDHLTQLIRDQDLRFSSEAKMPERIEEVEDFFLGLLASMKRGAGAELVVESRGVSQFIERNFDWSFRMGGNAGNMANVLAELGAEPVVNVPSLTPKQASFLHPEARVPLDLDGRMVLASPNRAAKEGEDLIHFVLQFEGGTKVETRQELVVTPRENRFIATFDHLNSNLHLDPAFEAYCHSRLNDVDGLLVSGFHLASSREVLDRRLEKIREWKSLRPELYVHVELGDFQDRDLMRHLVWNLETDSVGMNEDEIALLMKFPTGWRGLLNAASELRRDLEIRRVCVHTRVYTISVIKDLISPEKEVEALTYGADVAAHLVQTGRPAKYPDAKGLPDSEKLAESKAGSDAVNVFLEEMDGDRWGRGAYATVEEASLCLVPSMICDHPRVTVGIGDAMTAAAYYRELETILDD